MPEGFKQLAPLIDKMSRPRHSSNSNSGHADGRVDSSTSFGDSGGLRTRDALLTDTSSGARNCHALYTPFFHVPYLAQNSSELLVNRYIEC